MMVWGWWVLAQADGGRGDTTVLAIVVALILLGIGYLVLRAGLDKLTGAFSERAAYQLLVGDEGALTLVEEGEIPPAEPVSLDEAQMEALIEAVEARNEMRLHTVTTADGTEHAFEAYDPDTHGPSRAIVVEDSRGLLRISVAGIIEAEPPMDEAVAQDLIDVFEQVLSEAGDQTH